MSTTTRSHPLRSMLRILIAPAVWVERARGWKRMALVLIYALVAIVTAGWAHRTLSLRSVPDIAEPFDVASFADPIAPESDDALIVYRQAEAKLVANLPNLLS